MTDTPQREPEPDFSFDYRQAPTHEPDGRTGGYDPNGDAVAAEFRAAFEMADQPVEYEDEDADERAAD